MIGTANQSTTISDALRKGISVHVQSLRCRTVRSPPPTAASLFEIRTSTRVTCTLALFGWRRRSRWWFAFSSLNVVAAGAGILISGQRFDFASVTRLVEQFFNEGNTPSATRAGTVTFTHLTGSPRLVDSNEVADLPLRHVEAVTEFVVRLHRESLAEAMKQNHSAVTRHEPD